MHRHTQCNISDRSASFCVPLWTQNSVSGEYTKDRDLNGPLITLHATAQQLQRSFSFLSIQPHDNYSCPSAPNGQSTHKLLQYTERYKMCGAFPYCFTSLARINT